MLIRIEKSSGIPITRQILDQIRTQCATGALRPGDQLPSVRQLALDLAINHNTIVRVYERLEAEGLIERRHGSGTYVTDLAPDSAPALRAELAALNRDARSLARRARAYGMSVEQLLKLMLHAHKTLEPETEPQNGDDHAERD